MANDAHTIMNSPVTRIQVFAVWALCSLMLLGAVGAVVLIRLDDRLPVQPVMAPGGHGIETSWPSARGDHRLWTLSQSGTGEVSWLDEHIMMFKAAQERLPIKRN